MWLHGYVKPGYHPPLALPTGGDFWLFLFKIVGKGFGFEGWAGSAVGGGVLTAYLLLGVRLVRAGRRERSAPLASSALWAWYGLAISVFAMLSGISLGRARSEERRVGKEW